MNGSARVQSVEVIEGFRADLWKFAEAVSQSTSEAEGEAYRVLQWLDHEAGPYWQRELRQCQQKVHEAKQALNSRKLYKAVDGSHAAAVEQEQALAAAERQLKHAEDRLAKVKQWRRELDRRMSEFKPALQTVARIADQTIPDAVAHLDRLTSSLQAYLAMAPPSEPETSDQPADDRQAESIARPEQGTPMSQADHAEASKPDSTEAAPKEAE